VYVQDLVVCVNTIAPIGALVTNLSGPQVCHLPVAVMSQTSCSELVIGIGHRYCNNLPIEAIREEFAMCTALPSQPTVQVVPTTQSCILPFLHYNEIDHIYHPSQSLIESPENIDTNFDVTVSPIQELVNNDISINMSVGNVVRDSHSTDGAYEVKNNDFILLLIITVTEF